MTRFALAVLLLFTLTFAADAKSERSPLDVKLELSTSRCRLLEEITVEVDVRSKMTKKTDLRPIRLASDSVTLRFVEGDKVFRLSRIYGRATATAAGVEIKFEHERAVTVARNKKITGTFKISAIRPGKYEVYAEYHGADGIEMIPSTKPVTLTVDAPDESKKMVALITTSAGTMTAELDPDVAFNTVHEFVRNSEARFYGKPMIFFRVLKGFMAQVGDKTNTGQHQAGHLIPAEFNDTKHVRGVLSIARGGHPDTGGSQFFVMHDKSEFLDGKYTAFGRVIDGIEVLDEICDGEMGPNPTNTAEMSRPKKPVTLDQISVIVK